MKLPANATIKASQKKASNAQLFNPGDKNPSQSVPACTSLGCKTDSNAKYTVR